MTTMAPATVVTGIARQPLPYGLFSTFTFRPDGADRWEGGGVTFESLSCGPAQGLGPFQCGGVTTGLPKTLTNATGAAGAFGSATPFTVYGHFHCGPVGWTPQSAQAKSDEHLAVMEAAAVEKAFWDASLGQVPALVAAGTTDITSAGAAFCETLGLLENWIASHYGSLGVIHMTRQAALTGLSIFALDTAGGRLTTRLGTLVAAGGGYPGTGPAGQAAPAHATWMYATPALMGYRSEVFHSSNRDGDLFNRANNDLIAISERSYLLGFDPCGVAAALATLAGGIDGGTP